MIQTSGISPIGGVYYAVAGFWGEVCVFAFFIFALSRLTGVIEKLVVYPQNMMKNLEKFRGLVHSQRVMLALTQKGVSREDSYRMVQRNAMKVWEEGKDFMTELKADPEVTAAMTDAEIEQKFDLGYHTKHVDTIFARVFGD